MTGDKRVAFLGLGAMGLPMAANLAEAGYLVAGSDVVSAQGASLAERGGQAAAPPAEAAQGAEAVVAIPFDAAQTRDCLLGAGGAFETLPAGSLVILMSTIGPRAMRELAADIQQRGYRVVDAPVTGGAARAIDGTLTVIGAGAPADLDAAEPILMPMSGQRFRVGTEPGQGQMVKMVNQLLVGTHLAAAAEAMALARAAGTDLQQVYDLLITGQARSEMLVSRARAFLSGEMNTGASLRIFTTKDMPLVLDAGREFHVPMMTASAAFQTMQLGSAFGIDDLTDADLIRLLADPASLVAELTAGRPRPAGTTPASA
jgi:3-hydroxyisobutyrate dehydrogenase